MLNYVFAFKLIFKSQSIYNRAFEKSIIYVCHCVPNLPGTFDPRIWKHILLSKRQDRFIS